MKDNVELLNLDLDHQIDCAADCEDWTTYEMLKAIQCQQRILKSKLEKATVVEPFEDPMGTTDWLFS